MPVTHSPIRISSAWARRGPQHAIHHAVDRRMCHPEQPRRLIAGDAPAGRSRRSLTATRRDRERTRSTWPGSAARWRCPGSGRRRSAPVGPRSMNAWMRAAASDPPPARTCQRAGSPGRSRRSRRPRRAAAARRAVTGRAAAGPCRRRCSRCSRRPVPAARRSTRVASVTITSAARVLRPPSRCCKRSNAGQVAMTRIRAQQTAVKNGRSTSRQPIARTASITSPIVRSTVLGFQ